MEYSEVVLKQKLWSLGGQFLTMIEILFKGKRAGRLPRLGFAQIVIWREMGGIVYWL